MLFKPLITGSFKWAQAPPGDSEFIVKAGFAMFAVIETGGKQYKVQYGDVIYVEKLAAEEDSVVEFKVIALNDENGLKIGAPYVEGASVKGKVLKNGKAKKITVDADGKPVPAPETGAAAPEKVVEPAENAE